MSVIKIHSGRVISNISAQAGSDLLSVLRDNGFNIYSPCGGNGICGKCEVLVKGEGEVNSCQYIIERDMDIVIPGNREANILSAQHTHTVKVPFAPGEKVRDHPWPLGIAVDLGTTTIVFYLVNLITGAQVCVRSIINPQTRYGADVISRINYTLKEKDGLKKLHDEVVNAFNSQIEYMAGFASVTPEEIVKITVTGNPTMLHLLAGVDPSPIAFAPFTPAFTGTKILSATEAGLQCNQVADIILLPSVSAYVGADIVAGLTSLQPSDSYRNFLYLDIGTNGEMALVTPDRVYCCATAAGPAFEGGNISCGMGGLEGAISEVGEEGYTTIGDGIPAGICGSGLLDIVAFLVDKGIIDQDGCMEKDFIIVDADRTSTGKAVVLTPGDVREVQLAKSAIASGISILFERADLNPSGTDALFIAGGFGNYINTGSALRIGLIPPEFNGKIIPVGNASGTGAVLALKSVFFMGIIEKLLGKTEYIELSTADTFPEHFAMNMKFP